MTEITTNTDCFIDLINSEIKNATYGIEIRNVEFATRAYSAIWTIADVGSYCIQEDNIRTAFLDYVRRETAPLRRHIVELFVSVFTEQEDAVERCVLEYSRRD